MAAKPSLPHHSDEPYRRFQLTEELNFESRKDGSTEILFATDAAERNYAVMSTIRGDYDPYDEDDFYSPQVKIVVREKDKILALAWVTPDDTSLGKAIATGVHHSLAKLPSRKRLSFDLMESAENKGRRGLRAEDSRGYIYEIRCLESHEGTIRESQLLIFKKNHTPVAESLLIDENMSLSVADTVCEYLCPQELAEQSGLSSEALSDENCKAIIGVVVAKAPDHVVVNYTGAYRWGHVEGTGLYLAKVFNSLNAAKNYVDAGWKASGANVRTVINDKAQEDMGRRGSGEFLNIEDFLMSKPWEQKSFEADVVYLYTADGWVIATEDMVGVLRVNTTLNRVYEMHVQQLNDEIYRLKDLSNTYLQRLQSI